MAAIIMANAATNNAPLGILYLLPALLPVLDLLQRLEAQLILVLARLKVNFYGQPALPPQSSFQLHEQVPLSAHGEGASP